MFVGHAQLGALSALVAAPATRDGLRQFQLRRLQALVRHAYERVPYYRTLLDRAGLTPGDIRTLDDLRRIPMSHRGDFSDVPERNLIARGVDQGRIVRYSTSGSTGVPMVVRCTPFESRVLQAFRMRAMMRLGLRPADRRSLVRIVSGGQRAGTLEKFGLFRSRTTNAAWSQERIAADLRAWRPDVVRGYPSVLASVATGLTDEDRATIRPRFITTDSENLEPYMRRQIEDGFGAPVFDVYDCWECNVIARQCLATTNYHTLDAAVIVEIVRDGQPAGPGESGEVVITSLHSWAAPLVRYRIGDLAQRGPDVCACGSPNSCIAQVQGRVQDQLVLADGRQFPRHLVDSRIYPFLPHVKRYQVVQERIGRLVVRLQPVVRSPPNPAQIRAMKAMMARDLGDGVQVEVELVEDIPSEPSGKLRTVRCMVSRAT